MIIKEVQCKSILTKSNLPEVEYCINPYIGCTHNCVYCYASFMKRFTGHTDEDWGDFLDVRVNSVEVLKKQITSKKKRGDILIGSVTDSYQPIENKYRLTRQILEVLGGKGFPVSVLTKSDLVVRDIDVLKKIEDCEVGLTITSLGEGISRIFEPGASIPLKRVNALRVLKENGIRTYAFIGPMLPGITQIEEIVKALEGKVDFVMFETLNLNKVNRERTLKAFLKAGVAFSPNSINWGEVEKKARRICGEYGIPVKGFYKH
ncbi:MAG: radical SAM protein [Patescibacteria group bacterium]|nr:radical SAM protein [Patescibacteria group bacterium]